MRRKRKGNDLTEKEREREELIVYIIRHVRTLDIKKLQNLYYLVLYM